MFESTVNELEKYTMAAHNKGLADLKAADILATTRESFHENQPITEAAKVLIKGSKTGLPVLNSTGALVGFLSEKDCLKHIFSDELNNVPLGNVGDYMVKELVTFAPDTSIYHIIECFISKPFYAYPVVENGKYVGIIRRSNVLKAILKRGEKL